jgi:PAS domain S-box-containing protein
MYFTVIITLTNTQKLMILLPQGRNILIIAASMFVATFSLVLFVMTDAGGSHDGSSLKTSVFEEFFKHGEEAGHEVAEKEVITLTVDAAGLIREANHGFQEALGYELKDIKDKTLFTLVVADDLTHFAKDYGDVMKDGKIVVNSGPYRFMSEDGSEHVVLVTFTPGKKGAMTLTFKDITESLEKKDDGAGAAKGKSIKDHEDEKESKTRRIIVEKTS